MMKKLFLVLILALALFSPRASNATPHNLLYNDPTNSALHGLHVPGFQGTKAQRLAYSTAGLYLSDQWFETDTLQTYQWNGSYWNHLEFLGADTATFTKTFTSTKTNTPTFTNTPTNTATPTFTRSPTCNAALTPGCANQGTFTPTPSPTCASTGCANQGTFTLTPTKTNTITPTPTGSATPTITCDIEDTPACFEQWTVTPTATPNNFNPDVVVGSQCTPQSPVTNLIFYPLVGNSIVLSPGQWEIFGKFILQELGGSVTFSFAEYSFSDVNGDGGSSVPAPIVPDAGDNNQMFGENSNDVQGTIPADNWYATEPFFYTTAFPVTIYLNLQVFSNDESHAAIQVDLWARRTSKANHK